MAVLVKLELKSGSGSEFMNALVNSAYETEKPEVLIPKTISDRLQITKKLTSVKKTLADGSTAIFKKAVQACQVSVVEEDRTVGPVVCDVIIVDKAKRILMSDVLTSRLNIVILDLERGLWCFRDEINKRIRESRR